MSFGSFTGLPAKLQALAQCDSVVMLLNQMLGRLESSFAEYALTLPHMLRLIAVSNFGMMEDELTDLLGLDSSSMAWHLLLSSVRFLLVERSGRFNFIHNFCDSIVHQRYFQGTANSIKLVQEEIYSCVLARRRRDDVGEARAQEELPSQLLNLDPTTLNKSSPTYFLFLGDPGATGSRLQLFNNSHLQRVKGAAVLRPLRFNIGCTHLEVSGNDLSSDQLEALGEVLLLNPYLQSLALANDPNVGPRLRLLAPGLTASRSLRALVLSNAALGSVEAMQLLGQALSAGCRALVALDLSRNNLDAACAQAFFASLTRRPHLSLLNLSHNKIGDDGCKALAIHFVRNNTRLIELHLAENATLTAAALGSLAEAAQSANIEIIDLSGWFFCLVYKEEKKNEEEEENMKKKKKKKKKRRRSSRRVCACVCVCVCVCVCSMPLVPTG